LLGAEIVCDLGIRRVLPVRNGRVGWWKRYWKCGAFVHVHMSCTGGEREVKRSRRSAGEIVTYIWNLFPFVIIPRRMWRREVKSGGLGSTFSIGAREIFGEWARWVYRVLRTVR
jgi:hypothetical protein